MERHPTAPTPGHSWRATAALLALLLLGAPAQAGSSLTLFESGHVRPLALSPDATLLFAVNTPDNRLEIFQVQGNGLTHRASVPVGLEPVAVAARSNTEVWVVNHLSDSVSVVDVDAGGRSGHVTRTLLVGDEPRDIVFAGTGNRSASFVTTNGNVTINRVQGVSLFKDTALATQFAVNAPSLDQLGSFGQVVRCIDHKDGTLVAVKIIRNKKRFHQQALVEVNILKKLREWVSDDNDGRTAMSLVPLGVLVTIHGR